MLTVVLVLFYHTVVLYLLHTSETALKWYLHKKHPDFCLAPPKAYLSSGGSSHILK